MPHFLYYIALLYFVIVLLHVTNGEYIHRNGSDNHVNSQNWILNWEAPAKIRKNFPYYKSGYDYENRAILVVQMGKWNAIPLLRKGGKDLEDLSKYIKQMVERIGSGYFSKTADKNSEDFSDQVVLILDYDGLSMWTLLNVEYTKFNNDNLGKLNDYSDKIAFGYAINASAVAKTLIQLMRSRLGNIFERIEVYGTQPKDWIPHLLRDLPQDQLKREYGGVLDFHPVTTIGSAPSQRTTITLPNMMQ